jgi:8-oxo-dGTP pyrophosphatase MutT (NUDIX family)
MTVRDERGLRIRQAARALVLTDDGDVVLVRFEFPAGTRWALPGGGLERGETHVDAIRRELAEEVGLTDVDVGPHVWTREHIIPFLDGSHDGQREHVHLVRVATRFEIRPHLSAAQLRREFVHELRWWTAAELAGAAADGVTIFAPRRLPELVAAIHRDGVPAAPVEAGV